MFNNVGDKIKKYAVIIFDIILVVSLVAAMVFIVEFFTTRGDDGDISYIINGIVLLIFGPIIAYITSMFIYGFGELICNSDEAKKSLKRIEMEKCVNNYQNNIKIGLEPDKEAENADSNQSSNSDE